MSERMLEDVLGLSASELCALEQPCKDEHLCELALSITRWPLLATFMGITEPEVEAIMVRWPRDAEMQRIGFLRKWKDKLGQSGTYRELCETFCRIGVTSYAIALCSILFCEKSQNSSSASYLKVSAGKSAHITASSYTPDSDTQTLSSPPILISLDSLSSYLEEDLHSALSVQPSTEQLESAMQRDCLISHSCIPHYPSDSSQQVRQWPMSFNPDSRPLLQSPPEVSYQCEQISEAVGVSEHPNVSVRNVYSGSSFSCVPEDRVNQGIRKGSSAGNYTPSTNKGSYASVSPGLASTYKEGRDGKNKVTLFPSHSLELEHKQVKISNTCPAIIHQHFPKSKPTPAKTQRQKYAQVADSSSFSQVPSSSHKSFGTRTSMQYHSLKQPEDMYSSYQQYSRPDNRMVRGHFSPSPALNPHARFARGDSTQIPGEYSSSYGRSRWVQSRCIPTHMQGASVHHNSRSTSKCYDESSDIPASDHPEGFSHSRLLGAIPPTRPLQFRRQDSLPGQSLLLHSTDPGRGFSDIHQCHFRGYINPGSALSATAIHKESGLPNIPPKLSFGLLDKLAETFRKRVPSKIPQPGFADDKLERLTLIGGGGITEERKSIQVTKIFSLDQQRRKIVLVEGCPGSGKSVLGRHVFQKWAKQESFQNFKVVIPIDLEEQKVQSIANLIPADDIEHVQACRGRGVLFILDGWDRFVRGDHNHSILEKLICSPEEIQLDLSALLITSQPSASFDLQQYASSRICITDPLDSFAEYLRQIYRGQTPGFVTLQWPPPLTQKVFNLAIIHTETIRRAPPNEELVRLMMRGAVPEIVRRNVSLLVEDIFKLGGRVGCNMLLVEGAPGSGKSTLAWHIVQKWMSGELFQEFKIVIFVQLRDPTIQAAQFLSDLFPTVPEEMKQKAVDDIKARLGDGVLFVLDGWDEYKPGLNGGTLIQKLICDPHVLQLSSSMRLITSRPIASAQLQEYAANRVEVVGFTPNELNRYFQDVLKSPDSESEFYRQLQDRPIIEASCYIPLNAAIVVHLFKELNQLLPTTLYGIFSALVCGCLVRHLRKESESKRLTNISSLDEIPPIIEQPFKDVCTLAYEGVMEDKVTFTAKDLTLYNLSAELNVLSLMQGVESFACKTSKLYHFLHLSIQELLAAFHISKSPHSEQVQVFKDMFDQPRFAAVFRFYAAFTKLHTEGIRDIVTGITQSRNKDHLLNLLHCLNEAQDPSLCIYVASQLSAGLDLSHQRLSPLDCLMVGYFLSCVYSAWEDEFKVDLGSCSITDYSLGFLVEELSKSVRSSLYSDSSPRFLVLNLRNNGILEGGVRCLSELIRHPSVFTMLNLSQNEIQQNEDGLKYLLEGLKTNTSIQALELCGCSLRITAGNRPLLINTFRENTTLKTLNLSQNKIQEDQDGLTYLLESLKDNTSILLVILEHCSLTFSEEAGLMLVDLLKTNRTLQVLCLNSDMKTTIGPRLKHSFSDQIGLWKLYLTACGLRSTLTQTLIATISGRSSLEVLDLHGNKDISDKGIAAIAEVLRSSQSLRELDISGCAVTDQGMEAIAAAVKGNSMYKSDYTTDKGRRRLTLGKVLKVWKVQECTVQENSSLEILNLNGNRDLSSAGAAAIAEVLRHSHSLRELYVGRCGLTDQSMKSFAAALEVNSSLERLNLCGSMITNRGLLTLGEGLKNNRGLKELELWDCFSTTETGQRTLEQQLASLNKARKQQGLPPLTLLSY